MITLSSLSVGRDSKIAPEISWTCLNEVYSFQELSVFVLRKLDRPSLTADNVLYDNLSSKDPNTIYIITE